MNGSYHIYEWVMSHIWTTISHIWMSHVTHMNRSYHIYECVISHMWTGHITYMNESPHTEEWIMSTCQWVTSHIAKIQNAACHIRMSHFAHTNASCRTEEWVASYIHRKSSIYLPLSSVNLVLKLMGTPDGISTRSGWNRVSQWWCRVSPASYTEMVHVTHRAIQNVTHHAYKWVVSHLGTSCPAKERVMSQSHLEMSHVLLRNESCHSAT